MYYHQSDNLISLCSEIKGVLHNIPKIVINKLELMNSLVFNFSLGKNTIFKEIYRLLPNSILVIEKSGLKEFQNNHKFNFSNKSKEQLIKKISDELKKSTNLRVNKLKQKKYRIISDLTGGFDSRIILGSLSKTDSKVDYYTFEYIQTKVR